MGLSREIRKNLQFLQDKADEYRMGGREGDARKLEIVMGEIVKNEMLILTTT